LSWRPIHPHHAIERVKMSLVLSQAVPEKVLNRAASIIEETRADAGFGGMTRLQGALVQLTIGPAQNPQTSQPQPISGWQFARLAESGFPVEVVQLNGAELLYETAEYGSWSMFAERMRAVLGGVPAYVDSIISRRVTVLEYVDRFVFHGDPLNADARMILGGVSSALPDEAASGLQLWHIHRGWFKNKLNRTFLVNVNLATQDGNLNSGEAVRSLEVTTRIELRHTEENADISYFHEDLKVLHDISKDVFGSAMNEDVRKSIGLEEK
jgi:uncharacterized protein (TIGR04255 family)